MGFLEGFAPNQTQSSFLLVIKVGFGIMLFAFSPPLAVGMLEIVKKAHSSDAWNESIATIKQCKVIKKSLGGKPAYSPEIGYEFAINEKVYPGSRIALAASDLRSESDAIELAQKYAVGTKHPVFFDPSNPNDCALEKGAGWFHYLLLLVPVACFFGGPWLAWANGRMVWRRMKGIESPTEHG